MCAKQRLRSNCSNAVLGTFWIAKDAKFLHADNEDSDQTADVLETYVRRYVF